MEKALARIKIKERLSFQGEKGVLNLFLYPIPAVTSARPVWSLSLPRDKPDNECAFVGCALADVIQWIFEKAGFCVQIPFSVEIQAVEQNCKIIS